MMHLKCRIRSGMIHLISSLSISNVPRTTLFFIVFLQRLPFDWQNPLGYVIAFILQYILTFNLFVTVLGILIFGAAICSMLISLVEDMKRDLDTLKASARAKCARREILMKFCHLIELHSNEQQLSKLACCCCSRPPVLINIKSGTSYLFARFVHDFFQLVKRKILILFVWSILTICGTMLMVQMEIVECFFLQLK